MKFALTISFFVLSSLSLRAQNVDYPTQIQTIFNASCTGCHGNNNPSAGLRLTTYQNVIDAGIVNAGNAEASRLYEKVRLDQLPSSGARMPFGGALSQTQVNLIRDWINQGATATDNEKVSRRPEFVLKGNYPNPFNPGTAIAFTSPAAARVDLHVFNILGQQIFSKSMIASEGSNAVYVELKNQPSGLYLYRLTASLSGALLFNQTRTMLLVK